MPTHSAPRRVRPRLETLEDRLAPASLRPGFAEAPIAQGLNRATAMEVAPDGRVWVLEQDGDVEVFHQGSATGWNALDIPAGAISSVGERGLLGIAFDPNYNVNTPAADFVYLYYTSTASPNPHNRISRFTVNNANPDQPTLGGETVILELDALSGATNHNGGAIHFGPDGKLYVAVGENAAGDNSQSLSNRLGKILRINADGTIPADNPTAFPGIAGSPAGANRAIWAVGLRNPFTFTFQPGTGRMFINDVGAGSFEEINQGRAGANYGWPATEGNFNKSQFPAFKRPFYSYAHGSGTFEGFAITGGAFYNPAAPGNARFPNRYAGDYFFADFGNSWINVIDLATRHVRRFASGASGTVDLRVRPDGSLLYLARGEGQVYRVVFTANQPAEPFQQDGGATGLVVMEAEHFDTRVRQRGKEWLRTTARSGFSGTGALQALPNTGVRIEANAIAAGPRADFRIDFAHTGIHFLWVRGLGPSRADDSLYVGLDGNTAGAVRLAEFPASYRWKNQASGGGVVTIDVTSTGIHTLNIWMREDGMIVDKILLTRSAAFNPNGRGPAESPRG